MAADEIWASPSSITGSIGIGAYFPTIQRTLDKLGIHVDGVGTTPLAGDFRTDRAPGRRGAEILQLGIQNGYQRFISKRRGSAATCRSSASTRSHAAACGSARRRSSSVSSTSSGSLNDAIDSAATLAGVHDDYRVEFIEREPSFRRGDRDAARPTRAAWFQHSALLERSPLLGDGGPSCSGSWRAWSDGMTRAACTTSVFVRFADRCAGAT